jgi:alkanesulfonate monooxygenase SsuD/methylene tetrahydromethanopterin reductase-like flavin-dependent oxidoreductase (luciferase family)
LLGQISSCSAVGTKDIVKRDLEAFIRRTNADEVILTSHVYDHGERLRSYELAAEVGKELAG